MKRILVLVLSLFIPLAFGEVPADPSHVRASRPLRPTANGPREKKIQALKNELNQLEVRKLELKLEAIKLEKLDSGKRDSKAIERDLVDAIKSFDEKTKELEATEKLREDDECKAEFAIAAIKTSIKDAETGRHLGYSTANYLVCDVVADTCHAKKRPVGLVSTFGSDVTKEYIKGDTDTRVGKDCYCTCR